jgi:predicted unusual protein kinase regulating ubiquinone biosynthesis (AarF/ABC1/UbiB family)
MSSSDDEANRLSGRLSRYARVGTGVGGFAARAISSRALGRGFDRNAQALELARLLGGLKGPIMKVAQLAATVPDVLPPEYAFELQKLQAEAPPMGWAFVRRRMQAELGPDWTKRFKSFEHEPAAAASLGQVHRATAPDGTRLACKLQYPDMQSAVEADLGQLGVILSVQRRFSPEIDTREILKELGERLREELDYAREAAHMRLYSAMLTDAEDVRVPRFLPELSTKRLLTMTWLDGERLLSFVGRPLEERNLIATALFHAWWRPFARYGVIHGDPHLGNYTVIQKDDRPAGLNLLDYGCIRIFSPRFVEGVVSLYRGFQHDDRSRIAEAYRIWGFRDLNDELVDTLSLWARFIFAPLLDDRVRTIADGVAPHTYGRREVWEVKQRLKPKSPVTIPREFVLMNRAAVGLGAVFLHLKAELNFHRLFEAEIEGFEREALAKRQAEALGGAGLPLPEAAPASGGPSG